MYKKKIRATYVQSEKKINKYIYIILKRENV